MLVEALFFLVTVLVIVFIVLYALPRPTKGSTDVYPLKSAAVTSILSNSDFAWSAKPCSVRFLLQITQAPRTLQAVDCVPPPASTPMSTFDPTCPTYDFATCKCQGISCTECNKKTTNNSYLSKIFRIGDCVELWCAGYTTSNDKPYVPALLKIKTSTDPTQWFYESVSLPAIPLQRWTVITIVKEGRRFDIYYGAKMVATKVLDHFPLAPSSLDQWIAGSNDLGWSGKIGYLSVFTHAENSDDVLADVASVVDTRGVPYDQITLSLKDVKFPTCVGGDCLRLPTVGAPNPFVMWASTVS